MSESISSRIDRLETHINKKFDEIAGLMGERDRAMIEFTTAAKSCKKQCDKTHDAVFGNGSAGIKSKVWVLWGAMLFIVPAVVSLVVAAVKFEFFS